MGMGILLIGWAWALGIAYAASDSLLAVFLIGVAMPLVGILSTPLRFRLYRARRRRQRIRAAKSHPKLAIPLDSPFPAMECPTCGSRIANNGCPCPVCGEGGVS